MQFSFPAVCGIQIDPNTEMVGLSRKDNTILVQFDAGEGRVFSLRLFFPPDESERMERTYRILADPREADGPPDSE